MSSIETQLTTHPRGHVVERETYQHRGRPTWYRAQVANLAIGDTLAEFGKVLEWSEAGTADGWTMYRMVTERPQHYPVETNVFVVPSYVYYGITALAEPEAEGTSAHCACRDCMDTIVANNPARPELCDGCNTAGCGDPAAQGWPECQRDDAYGDGSEG